jgi:integrase
MPSALVHLRPPEIAIIDAARLAKVARPTFGQVADEFLAAKVSEWRNSKHRAQWNMTLEKYAGPLRARPVNEIDTAAVLEVLQPLWRSIPETASRLRGRIETVLDAARARGLIGQHEANPARWRGHLDKLLPKRQKLTRGHHAAMPFADVPAFLAQLRERESVAALALEFTILTAARTCFFGMIAGATVFIWLAFGRPNGGKIDDHHAPDRPLVSD